MDDTGIITVRDLRRRYGGSGGRGFEAVRGVTFSVCRGELFALLGTNGAGKTSAMEVLEGLAPKYAALRDCPPVPLRSLPLGSATLRTVPSLASTRSPCQRPPDHGPPGPGFGA